MRSTEYDNGQNDKPHSGGMPHCPRCGSVLVTRLLKVPDEDEPETLLLFDCPRDDFHGTATHKDIITVLTAAVREQLGF